MNRLIISFILLFFLKTVCAQEVEYGRPFIKNFSSKEYKTTPYNYGILQDNRGLIYVANYAGVLIYDGVDWRSS